MIIERPQKRRLQPVGDPFREHGRMMPDGVALPRKPDRRPERSMLSSDGSATSGSPGPVDRRLERFGRFRGRAGRNVSGVLEKG
jgi:hypothetical protein